MKVNHEKILESQDSNMAAYLLKDESFKFNDYHKVLAVRHWMNLGSPEDLKDDVLRVVKNDKSFMNGLILKLLDVEPMNLFHGEDFNGREGLENDGYKFKKPIVGILFKKLNDLKDRWAPNGFHKSTEVLEYSDSKKSLKTTYMNSAGTYNLFTMEAIVEGYRLMPSIRMGNRPEELIHLVTDRSLRALKGIIYQMTEDDVWDAGVLDRALESIEFKSPLNNLVLYTMCRIFFDVKLKLLEEGSSS